MAIRSMTSATCGSLPMSTWEARRLIESECWSRLRRQELRADEYRRAGGKGRMGGTGRRCFASARPARPALPALPAPVLFHFHDLDCNAIRPFDHRRAHRAPRVNLFEELHAFALEARDRLVQVG